MAPAQAERRCQATATWNGRWLNSQVRQAVARRGFRDNQEVAYTERRTTGVSARLTLYPDRKTICADGDHGVVMINVTVEDENGLVVPQASDRVHFSVTGSAKILGMGNSNPSSHEADKTHQRSAFGGWCQVTACRAGNHPAGRYPAAG